MQFHFSQFLGAGYCKQIFSSEKYKKTVGAPSTTACVDKGTVPRSGQKGLVSDGGSSTDRPNTKYRRTVITYIAAFIRCILKTIGLFIWLCNFIFPSLFWVQGMVNRSFQVIRVRKWSVHLCYSMCRLGYSTSFRPNRVSLKGSSIDPIPRIVGLSFLFRSICSLYT